MIKSLPAHSVPQKRLAPLRALIGPVVAAALCASCASLIAPDPVASRTALRAGTYTLDPAHASVLFKIDHLGFSTYIGRFEDIDASLDFDSDDPAAAQLQAVIDMTSLDIANDDFAQTLMGPDWFDAATYPQAVFTSKAITVTGDATGQVRGDLTLKGVTAPLTLDVTFNGGARDLVRGAYVTGFSGRGVIDRTTFGVDAFAGLIANNVTLEIEAEFLRE